jgi:hypothetical protein
MPTTKCVTQHKNQFYLFLNYSHDTQWVSTKVSQGKKTNNNVGCFENRNIHTCENFILKNVLRIF